MPARPLVDLDQTDLSRVIVDSSEVRKHCLQRNRFAMLDGILHLSADGLAAVGFKDLSLDDWWVPDHIPGRPIFPGVLQLEGAAQLASYHFLTTNPEAAGKFVGFAGVNDTRFRQVVTPPARLMLIVRSIRVRPTMFNYAAQAFVDRKMVMDTEILGVIV